MKKKILSVILAIVFVMGCVPFANAQGSAPRLYNIFGDGMLLQQNKTSFIAGKGTQGDVVSLELVDGEAVIFQSEATVDANGEFSVAVDAPAGGFKAYKIILSVNGAEFRTLNNVVFGELWLASGQSNMQYSLSQAKYGADMFANGEKLSEWLRVLYVPDVPEYKGSKGMVPAYPQREIPGAQWFTGEDHNAYVMSAVAYYFADALTKGIDVPVGIINVPLGGTTIPTWLSRQAIDSDPAVKNALIAHGAYIEKSAWNEANANVYYDMTSNYNLKMEGIRDFSIAGMIWYQGESDVIYEWTDEEYAAAFDLMQRSYTELFRFEDGLLPIVFTQLAPYYYFGDNTLFLGRNASFTKLQAAQPDSRAVISIHDVSPTYIPEAGAIHPECKKEVGERMAFAAQGLVYDKYSDYTAPSVKSTQIKNGSIYVTFSNVGDGLKAKGDALKGFALCGSDGIYVSADAEIVSADTVRVFNSDISNPVAASYAYYTSNHNANLFATKDGEYTLPVSTFITDRATLTHHWTHKPWADCDTAEVWHIDVDPYAGNYPTWEADNADVSFVDGGVNFKKAGKGNFIARPVTMLKDKDRVFRDVDSDYSDYGTMSFYVKNNSQSDITLKGVRYYVSAVTWYAPAVDGTRTPQATIPADGQWHKITLNLDRIYLNGNEGGIGYTNEKLTDVRNIDFVFDSKNDADLTIDSITFTPSVEEVKADFSPEFKNADNILEIISAIFVNIIGLFVRIFR